MCQYQNGKTNLDFTEARDSEWQRHQLGTMQVSNSLQTDNHASIPLDWKRAPQICICISPDIVKQCYDTTDMSICMCDLITIFEANLGQLDDLSFPPPHYPKCYTVNNL